MTPKEKAEELFNEFSHFFTNASNSKELTKQSAIIVVNENMRFPNQLMYDICWIEHRQTDINNWLDTKSTQVVKMNALQYWQQVKYEIKKL